MPRTTKTTLLRQNLQLVKQLYPGLSQTTLSALRDLTRTFRLSVSRREILCIDDRWYITHTGLLQIALRRHCHGIRTVLQERQCDSHASRWVFKATVYKGSDLKAFVGYGDADPSNTSLLVRGAEMRVAETRAVNRALRKAYGIGLCSVEELGSFSGPPKSFAAPLHSNGHPSSNGSNNGQPRLRDQLCVLIRRHNLDPTLVKAYAADFCGTATLKEASRDLVESFVCELATAAKNDRDSLLCKLNSYAPPTEVKL
ncbi:MAG: hypothetical protein WCD43_12015 [Candidatus Acidiferrales bacterium]